MSERTEKATPAEAISYLDDVQRRVAEDTIADSADWLPWEPTSRRGCPASAGQA